jgi:hypothetical protein
LSTPLANRGREKEIKMPLQTNLSRMRWNSHCIIKRIVHTKIGKGMKKDKFRPPLRFDLPHKQILSKKKKAVYDCDSITKTKICHHFYQLFIKSDLHILILTPKKSETMRGKSAIIY